MYKWRVLLPASQVLPLQFPLLICASLLYSLLLRLLVFIAFAPNLLHLLPVFSRLLLNRMPHKTTTFSRLPQSPPSSMTYMHNTVCRLQVFVQQKYHEHLSITDQTTEGQDYRQDSPGSPRLTAESFWAAPPVSSFPSGASIVVCEGVPNMKAARLHGTTQTGHRLPWSDVTHYQTQKTEVQSPMRVRIYGNPPLPSVCTMINWKTAVTCRLW